MTIIAAPPAHVMHVTTTMVGIMLILVGSFLLFRLLMHWNDDEFWNRMTRRVIHPND